MTESPVVFLDSGIGGLPYLEQVSRQNIRHPLIYVADTQHFPYGELSDRELKSAVVETSAKIFDVFKPALMIIACNTASVSALAEVRAIASCPVVGTVPAVKPAAASGNGSAIGVLATEATVNSPYLDNLVEAFASDRKIYRQAAGDIVRFVEQRWLEEGEEGAAPVVGPALEQLKSAGVESLVLGCTHFLHVLPVISRIMGRDVKMIDSRDGVGRRILYLLDEGRSGLGDSSEDAEAPKPDGSTVRGRFYVTQPGESDSRYHRFAEAYGLDWGGKL